MSKCIEEHFQGGDLLCFENCPVVLMAQFRPELLGNQHTLAIAGCVDVVSQQQSLGLDGFEALHFGPA